MSELVMAPDGAVAMLEGLLARGAASRLHYLSASNVTLAVLVLASPCGEIVDEQLVLAQADPLGDLILATGFAVSAVWSSDENTLRGSGALTDEAGRLAGVVQPKTVFSVLAAGRTPA